MNRDHARRLERAEALLDDAGRLLREQRPLTVSAALTSENAPFPMWSLDRDHRLLWANREWEAMFGTPAGAARGHTLAELWGPEHAEVTTSDELVMGVGRPYRYEMFSAAGERHRVIKWPLRAEDGAVIGICGAIT